MWTVWRQIVSSPYLVLESLSLTLYRIGRIVTFENGESRFPNENRQASQRTLTPLRRRDPALSLSIAVAD